MIVHMSIITVTSRSAGGTVVVHMCLTTVTSRSAGGTVVVHMSLATVTGRSAGGTVVVHVSLTTVTSRSAGGTVVVHVSLTTVTMGLIPALCSYLIKITLVTCEKHVTQFVSTKHCRFSPGTPVSSCSNTGPMRGGLFWTSRENSLYIVADRVI